MPDDSKDFWMPIQHYFWSDDRKVGMKELRQYAHEGIVKIERRAVHAILTRTTSEECILITGSNKALLFKKPRQPRVTISPEDSGRYGWKYEERILAEYKLTPQNVVDAANAAKLRIDAKYVDGRPMIRLTEKLERALASYKPVMPDIL